MAQDNITVASSRAVRRIDCLESTAVPQAVSGDVISETNGVYNVSGHIYPLTSGQAGTPYYVKAVPGRGADTSFDLTVYGAFRTVGANGLEGPWVWVPLFKCTVATLVAHTGAQATDVVETGEYLAATITSTSGGSGEAKVTSYGATVGPAHIKVPTDGAPYLLFVASVAGAFVLAGGQS